MKPNANTVASEPTPRLLAGGGILAGLIGLVASSCCALPIALAGFGMASVAGSLIPMLAALRAPLLILAACLALAGWVVVLRRRRSCALSEECAPPRASRSVVLALSLVTGVVLLALLWPTWIEPYAIRWVR
jgi:mercuric ion transport protein